MNRVPFIVSAIDVILELVFGYLQRVIVCGRCLSTQKTIALDGFYTKQDYPDHLRRIRFKDPETAMTLVIAMLVLLLGSFALNILQEFSVNCQKISNKSNQTSMKAHHNQHTR